MRIQVLHKNGDCETFKVNVKLNKCVVPTETPVWI